MTILQTRLTRYYKLCNELAQLDNQQLQARFDADNDQTQGWGTNHVLTVGAEKVFVKRLPMTQAEYEHPFATRNLYDLPTFYNYGVGSAGFGVYRELVTHIKTTNWVLAGECDNFPLLYGYRILPRSADGYAPINEERHERYVAYWNGDATIGRFTRDRANAPYELVLLLEYIPSPIRQWLRDNPDQTMHAFAELSRACTFLREKGILHFDVHFGNVVVGGNRPILSDFGLVLDQRFDLSIDEQAFWNAHTHYDYASLIFSFSRLLSLFFLDLPESRQAEMNERFGMIDKMWHSERGPILLANMAMIQRENLMTLDAGFVELLVRFRPIIGFTQVFFNGMRQNNRKDTPFDNEALKRLLVATGFEPQ